MKIHVKMKKDEETGENAIVSFEMVTNDKVKGLGLLPTDEVIVDADTVPMSFYREWHSYRVDKFSNPVLQYSHKLHAKKKIESD